MKKCLQTKKKRLYRDSKITGNTVVFIVDHKYGQKHK